jgi:prepilin-type N-terminal cleavage/methylation domain-containing protein
MHNKKFSPGFTIVELLIVVAIIGILAAVAVPAYYNHILRSRQADAYHNLLDLKAAQEMYISMYAEGNTIKYAGPYTPGQFVAGNTFTALLSFSNSDTQYYEYSITDASKTTFTAQAEGQYKKLKGNIIRITADKDPCIAVESELKMSLGLDKCSP